MSKRRDFTLAEKKELLKKYDSLPKMSQREAAHKLDVTQSFLCKFLKTRDSVQADCLNNENMSRKRKRCGKDEDVEIALKEWFTTVRQKDSRIDGPLMQQKAEDLAKQMGKDDFSATGGWFHRFKKRKNIVYSKLHGEQGEADTAAAETWIRDEWPAIISEYEPGDIYNADETGLFYRALPEHTYMFKGEKVKGSKTCKERITVLCCVSMTGEKKELLVIGKSKNPRCFKGVKQLAVVYSSSTNAWMTSRIFSEWLTKWDNELKRRILLLVDNFSGHAVDGVHLKNIRVVFLPANTTSLMQPCDQGIIRDMKAYYRKEMRRIILLQLEDKIKEVKANDLAKKTSLIDGLYLIAQAWDCVKESTVRNCFKKGGFAPGQSEEEPSVPVPSDMSEEEFDEWMNIDECFDISCQDSEEEISFDRHQEQVNDQNPD